MASLERIPDFVFKFDIVQLGNCEFAKNNTENIVLVTITPVSIGVTLIALRCASVAFYNW